MWKEVDEKTKEKYNSMAKKEKERADKEIAAYKAKKEGEDTAVCTPAPLPGPCLLCARHAAVHRPGDGKCVGVFRGTV